MTTELITEMSEFVNKYGSENSTTHLMVQAIQELRRLKAENEALRAQLEAPTRPAVPEGWKLVPEEPTPAMEDAADKAESQHRTADKKRGGRDPELSFYAAYRAMLAAAPQAEAPSLPTIKGASLSGGYVIVTPAGFGADKAHAVRDAILKLFPISPEYQPRLNEADAQKGSA